jgi:hypothetical protein
MSLNALRSKLNERQRFRENFLASQLNAANVKKETNGKTRFMYQYFFKILIFIFKKKLKII